MSEHSLISIERIDDGIVALHLADAAEKNAFYSAMVQVVLYVW